MTGPADRYRAAPRRGSRVAGYAAIGLLAAAFLSLVVWIGLDRGSPDVSWRLLAFDVRDGRRVSADVEVTADPGRAVTCDVAVLDHDHRTVGFRTVPVPAGPRTRTVAATVPARGGGVSVVVQTCRLTT